MSKINEQMLAALRNGEHWISCNTQIYFNAERTLAFMRDSRVGVWAIVNYKSNVLMVRVTRELPREAINRLHGLGVDLHIRKGTYYIGNKLVPSNSCISFIGIKGFLGM
jgi:hypothetical protein